MTRDQSELVDQIIRTQRELSIPGTPAESEDLANHDEVFNSLKLSNILAPSEREELIEKAQTVNENRMINEAVLLERVSEIEAELSEVRKDFAVLAVRCVEDKRAFTRTEMKIRESLLKQEEELTRRKSSIIKHSTDAFYAYHTRELEKYLLQLDHGKLVETPYVQEKLEQVMTFLRRHYYVLLHGDTGSGKTELAKLAGRRFQREIHGPDSSLQEPIVLRCYRGMGTEELFGHFSLKSSVGSSAADIPKRIDDAISQWKSTNISASEAKETEAIRNITQSVLAQSGCTLSEYIFGALYRAAKEGLVVILDEVNFAPPDMLVKLNEFLNLKPGDLVHVQEDAIAPFPMHKGFGLLCTGNIDYGSSKRYGSGRFDFEPSRLNRLTMIDYDYLPQAIKGTREEVTNPLKKQQYAIALASLIGERGIACLPEGSLETIWSLCKYARLTQIAFSGQLGRDNENAFQSAGATIEHRPEVLISPRNLVRILNDWKLDGFRYEIDHYLYEHFICSSLKPADGALLYQLAQKQGFFVSPKWSAGIAELEKVGNFPFRVRDPFNRSPDLRYFHREDIIEAIYGRAPARTDTETAHSKQLAKSAHLRLEFSELVMRYQNLKEQVLELNKEALITAGV